MVSDSCARTWIVSKHFSATSTSLFTSEEAILKYQATGIVLSIPKIAFEDSSFHIRYSDILSFIYNPQRSFI